ncbi:hypothetical protein MRB53_011477 [Persea americana]|uniref:Uncharacterized protein n=1 Tax=Persea americana TaxID=3435 RepID=A0ACC2LUX7_PERAE|nr:hypothetical protein MRB53_011477 [Persea americana]
MIKLACSNFVIIEATPKSVLESWESERSDTSSCEDPLAGTDGLGAVTPGSIGIVYCVIPDNSLLLELSYLPGSWHCEPEEVESVTPFRIGDQVCMKKFVAEPRYAWGGETRHNVGTISEIEGDGLLMIQIPNRPIPWQSNPVDMEKVESFKVTSNVLSNLKIQLYNTIAGALLSSGISLDEIPKWVSAR